MGIYKDIPAELYADDAVCFIASRYHVTTQEVIRGFLAQSGIALDEWENEMSTFHLEDNEVEILRGLMEAYRSMEDEEHKYI